ncbi:MAG: response regulator [Deltaproteobacteria bacterium]|nr:response regulator [Deltaproteobacteria bacterium]
MAAPPEWEREREELLARIRLLEADCALLADAQEELGALGLVAEQVRESSDPREVLRAGLERVAILRALPFCACGTVRGGVASLLEHYAVEREGPLPEPSLPLSPRVAAELARGSCLLGTAEVAEAGFDGHRPLPLRPSALLLLPFRSRDWGEGLFLFAHDRGPDELSAMAPLLQRVVEMLAGRVDHVALVRDLQALNASLDEKVRERTRELLAQIKERQKTEEALRQAQKLESVGRLAGGVAHDFNNALTTIVGVTDLLLADAPAGSPLAADLLSIRDAGRHAASLTRQLLAFSRKQRLEMAPLCLDELGQAFAGMLRRVVGEDVELRLDLAAGPEARVLADRGQLEQVLMNLAVNAREAMPRGGTLTLATRVEQVTAGAPGVPHGLAGGEHVRLTVTDTGVGMRPEVAAQVFDPFYTTKERGTGLGLSTVYGIVQQHEGQVAVESAPGAGSRFDVWLPLARGEARPAGETPAPVPRLLGGTETVLVVDDDPAVRALVTRVLSREGYRVLSAGSGAEALEMAEADGKVEALITDVVMPGMRGADLARAFLARWPDSPVLYMSGYAEDLALGSEAPLGDGFVAKPIVAGLLLSALRQALDRVRGKVARSPRPGAA